MSATRESFNVSHLKKIAVITGEGKLPHSIYREMRRRSVETWSFCPLNLSVKVPKYVSKVIFNPLDLEGLFFELRERDIESVVFAGKITRRITNSPSSNKSDDLFSREIFPILQETDDKVLREIGKIFEFNGFDVRGINELLPESLAVKGILTKEKPSKHDNNDIIKAINYHKILSKADIGQSLIVSSGLCLAVESLPGTDAMLDFIKKEKSKDYLDSDTGGGILYKAPKTNQDSRFDIPVIGETTIRKAKGANLRGIALQRDSVILLNKEKVIQLANQLRLFIVVL